MERSPYRRPNASTGSGRSSGAANQARASRPYPSRSGGAQYGSAPRSNRNSSYGRSSQAPRYTQSNRGSQFNRSARSPRPAQPNRGGGAPRRPMPPRRRIEPTAILAIVVASILALAGIVYVGSAWFISTINASTYCSNVFVNGIDLSHYSREEGAQRVREQLNQRLNSAYTLTWADSSFSFTATDFGAAIDLDATMDRAWNIGHVGSIFDRSAAIRSLKSSPVYLTAPLTYNEEQIDAYVSALSQQLYLAPRDAVVVADLSNPYLAEESANGQELDAETARSLIVSLIETGEGSSVLPVNVLTPAISSEQAMSSMELIVEYKTDTSARGYNGRFNVRKALSNFFGMVVQPGEEISFNKVVGPRTAERGWQLGTEYIGGGKKQEGYGGGVCQASTTLYGALLKAGMTILKRESHSMTVSYVNPSIDAAVTESGSKDLVFRNDTENPITIYTEVTKEYAMVQIYGVRPPYRYELKSEIIKKDSKASRRGYIDDEEGIHCKYTDEFELYTRGIPACDSEGWLIAYDWDTDEEVSRELLSRDRYQSGYDIYWRGVIPRDGGGAGEGAFGME